MYTGKIVKTYTQGQQIDVAVVVSFDVGKLKLNCCILIVNS
jgi:hypothetical protein